MTTRWYRWLSALLLCVCLMGPSAAAIAADPPAPIAGPAAAPLPVARVGEIILIRKDGRVLFASAFSVVGTQLRYISAEGSLQKFPVTELDAESTQQMNEARGNSVQISN